MPDRGTEIHAVLEGAGRIWAVAAVNGDSARLAALHGQMAEALLQGDRVVYLGNYLGTGGDPIGVIDELLRFRALALTLPGTEPWDIVYLRGIQEELWHKLLQLQFAVEPREVLNWMLGQGVGAALTAYGGTLETAETRAREGVLSITRWTNQLRAAMHARPGHDELMAALRRYAVTADERLLFVHAGIDPGRPLSQQGDTFWWGGAYFDAIERPYQRFVSVVRGFDRKRRGPIERPGTLSLDGGSGHGGPLNAVCLAPGGAVLGWLSAG